MNCNNKDDQLIDYLLNTLGHRERKRLEKHLSSCSTCQQKFKDYRNTEKLLKQWTPVVPPDNRKKLTQQLMDNIKAQRLIEKSFKNSLSTIISHEKTKTHSYPVIVKQHLSWRMIKSRKVLATAVAVLVVITFMLGINLFIKESVESVAWSSVLDKIEMIDNYKFQRRIKTTSAHQGTITRTQNVYHSSQYGSLLDQHWDMFGGLNIKIYLSFSNKTATVVHPRIKKYGRVILPEEQVTAIRNFDDPMYHVREIMSFDYRKLGRKVIDGKKVEGIEVNDPQYEKGNYESCVGRLWIDVETNLPVLYESKAIVGDGKIPIELIQDSYEWDIGRDENVFVPNLSGYTLITEIVSQPANEETAVQMLRNFSEMTGGKYPCNLALFTLRTKFNMMYREKMVEEIGFERAIYFWEEDTFEWEPFMRMNNQIIQTCQFYGNLAKEDKDMAYYGKLVTPDDVDIPLMRWKTSDSEYRVIFGDLSIKDVNTEQLAELEANLDKTQILHSLTPNF